MIDVPIFKAPPVPKPNHLISCVSRFPQPLDEGCDGHFGRGWRMALCPLRRCAFKFLLRVVGKPYRLLKSGHLSTDVSTPKNTTTKITAEDTYHGTVFPRAIMTTFAPTTPPRMKVRNTLLWPFVTATSTQPFCTRRVSMRRSYPRFPCGFPHSVAGGNRPSIDL